MRISLASEEAAAKKRGKIYITGFKRAERFIRPAALWEFVPDIWSIKTCSR